MENNSTVVRKKKKLQHHWPDEVLRWKENIQNEIWYSRQFRNNLALFWRGSARQKPPVNLLELC